MPDDADLTIIRSLAHIVDAIGPLRVVDQVTDSIAADVTHAAMAVAERNGGLDAVIAWMRERG